MEVYGMASAAEFLGDRIVYRNLKPGDVRLPGLDAILPRLGLPAGRVPRKHERDYARVVAYLLESARRQDRPDLTSKPLKRLFFVGDSELLDGTAFDNLCEVQGWYGIGFIGAETDDPPAARIVTLPSGRALYLANRWSGLEVFDQHCTQAGLPIDEQAAVVIDLDKTILGARGRNSQLIDRARSQAMEHTIAALMGEAFVPADFYQVYRQFNQAAYHPFTSDNQDYLAYICLMVLAGAVEASRLAEAVTSGEFKDFLQFAWQMDLGSAGMPVEIKRVHSDVFARIQGGDPTPFKAFRYQEYALTVSLMGYLPSDSPVDVLLNDEIVLTQEVRQAALMWLERGTLLFGLSDKPDEASVPRPDQMAQGFLPLHKTLTHVVGSLSSQSLSSSNF